MKNIYISPHFDDAVGSCGCKIYDDYLKGEKSVLITIFAKNVNKGFSDFANELHNMWGLRNPVVERKKENSEACAVLHLEVLNLEFVEAIYRKHDGKTLYPSSKSIFEDVKESDKGLESKIYQKLCQFISMDDNCYFPSGRGKHVDHILTKNVGEIFAKEGYNVSYYRDFFYKGENYDKKNYVKKYVRFESECLLRKVEAMKKYKSQIDMLFGGNSIEKYYLLENQKGEVYYEKK